MFSTCSWMRRRCLDFLITSLACIPLPLIAQTEEAGVYIGPHVWAADETLQQRITSVSEGLERLELDMAQVVGGFDDCQSIVAGPLENGRPRDTLRDTWTVIQTIRVECWMLLQLDPDARILPAVPGALAPAAIHGIMAKARLLSSKDDKRARTLMNFPDGEMDCDDTWRCRLSFPDGRNPPEQSVLFDLVAAVENRQFIIVTQMVYGRAGYVYGVQWQDLSGKGEVISIFPDPS